MLKNSGADRRLKQTLGRPIFKALPGLWLGLILVLVTACGDNTANPTSPVATGSPTAAASSTAASAAGSPVPSTAPATATTGPTGAVGTTATTTAVSTTAGQTTISPTQISAPTPTPTPANGRAYFDRIVIIVLENADYAQAIKQPYLQKLAGQGVLLTNYSGVAHPSYPNYLALVAGSTFGITSDGQTNLDKTTVMDLMDKKGVSWKFYAEQYPEGKCFTGVQSGNYVRKHLPALSFVEIQKDPALCGNVVPGSQFSKDIAANNLPDYSFYVPDLKNDGHDTGVAYASKWLEGFLGGVSNSPALGNRALVVVTFDESDNIGNNKIYTVLTGPVVKPGLSIDTQYDHYSLLRTVEENFQLGNLGREDAKAQPISGVWQNAK